MLSFLNYNEWEGYGGYMSILLNVLLLLVGFVALIKGADYFVEGSAAIAKRFNISEVIIGLTIVAMGTSAPELAVSISAALTGSNEIAISNVVGSNIFNLLMVLGACAIIVKVPVGNNILKLDYPFIVIVSFLIILFVGEFVFTGNVQYNAAGEQISGYISRWNAVILLILFVIYMVYTVIKAKKNREEGEKIENIALWKSIVFIIGGIIAIVVGGQLVVDNAKGIAAAFGMSETLIGLTIVAMGTSLPELVTSIVASKKGQNGMAVGNVVGSNIFNMLMILGVSCAINPIAVTLESMIDLIILFVISIIVLVIATTEKTISRKEGIVMLLLYAGYMTYAIIR